MTKLPDLHAPTLTTRPDLAFSKEPLVESSFKDQVKLQFDGSKKTDATLTVAIVAYNEDQELLSLIETVLHSAKSQKAKLLLVDNGLSAEIKSKVKEYPIHYIEAIQNLGCCGGRNLAAAYTNTELIAFVDADGAVNQDYVKQCLVAMQDPGTITARGKVLPLSGAGNSISSYDMGDKAFACPPMAEGISVWRTSVFKKAGGFETPLYGGEGIVLCHRLMELFGYRREQFIYYPGLVLHHDFGKNEHHLADKLVRNFINRWHVDRKYPLLERMLRDFRKDYINIVPDPTPQSEEFRKVDHHARAIFNTQLEDLKEQITRRRLKQPDKPKPDGTYNFSVIIPCYNLGPYVEKALRSCLAQTLDHIEVIIVDDESTDESTLRELRKLEQYVRVIYRKKNGGASAARNTGIKAAKSSYILCLDSDDMIDFTYLEEAFNVFEQDSRAGIVCSYLKQVGGSTVPWYPADNVSLDAQALISSPAPSASCFRREAWDQVNGYDENMRGNEDWEFWVSILERGWTKRSIPRSHFIYLNRPDSKVKTSDKKTYEIVSYIVTKHRKTYEENIVEVLAKEIEVRKKFRSEYHAAMETIAQMKSQHTQQLAIAHQSYAKKLLRKSRSIVRVIVIERDAQLLVSLLAMNIARLRKRIF